MKEGFDGGFVSYPLDTIHTVDAASGLISPPTTRDFTIPWPQYHRTPTGGLLYPPRLAIKHPTPFTLTLPGPTVVPLYRFLAKNFQLRIIQDLFALLYIWTRSMQMTEFTPTCLALMTIRFMQDQCNLPLSSFGAIPEVDLKNRTTGGWVLHEYQNLVTSKREWITEPVWLNTDFFTPASVGISDQSLGSLMFQFFRFCSVWL